jgi:3',5'-cyclic AMP phosphodiesterase CpdA
LDSDKPKEFLINDIQRTWLDADLARNKNKNIFVFFHEPAYPTNSKIGESLDTNPADRNALWAILKKYKVTAVFSGHEHINSRRKVDGIYQFGFGNTDSFDHLAPKPGMAEYSSVGANYGIVEVVNEQVTVKVFSTNGVLLNSFLIPR